jgi:hypothetical protein
MSTKEKLATALVQAHAPPWMIDKARKGGYDDYESESATPINDLVNDLVKHGLDNPAMDALKHDAVRGRFDGTKEESEAWMKREGRHLF